MKILFGFLLLGLIFSSTTSSPHFESIEEENMEYAEFIDLPSPELDGKVSVEKAISDRRSSRDFLDRELSLKQVSQLLWSAQGITADGFYRTAPSAGALYPLELYLVAGNIKEIEPGIYRYSPKEHKLFEMSNGDKRIETAAAALHQDWMTNAPALFVFAAVYDRTTVKYGDRGIRYAQMEVGYSGENLFLQCEALGLGTVVVGAFNDKSLKEVLSLKSDEHPLAIMPVGYKR